MHQISLISKNIESDRYNTCNKTQIVKNKDLKGKKYSNFLFKNMKRNSFDRNSTLNSQIIHVSCIDRQSENKVYMVNYSKK